MRRVFDLVREFVDHRGEIARGARVHVLDGIDAEPVEIGTESPTCNVAT